MTSEWDCDWTLQRGLQWNHVGYPCFYHYSGVFKRSLTGPRGGVCVRKEWERERERETGNTVVHAVSLKTPSWNVVRGPHIVLELCMYKDPDGVDVVPYLDFGFCLFTLTHFLWTSASVHVNLIPGVKTMVHFHPLRSMIHWGLTLWASPKEQKQPNMRATLDIPRPPNPDTPIQVCMQIVITSPGMELLPHWKPLPLSRHYSH